MMPIGIEVAQITAVLSPEAQKRTSKENVQDVLEALGRWKERRDRETIQMVESLPAYPRKDGRPPERAGNDQYRFVVDTPANALVIYCQETRRVEIWPKEGGYLETIPMWGDIAPFAG